MTRDEAHALARGLDAADPARVCDIGFSLVREDYAEFAMPMAREAAARHPREARVQQLLGLAARTIGESRTAVGAFADAARLAPNDALIAHSHARTALEAGLASIELFDKAARLAPRDGFVLLGRAAAQLQEGHGERAIADLAQLVAANPMWTDGHRSLAHLRGQFDHDPVSQIDAALSALPRQDDLHRLKVATLLEARDFDRATKAVEAAMAVLGKPVWLVELAAHIASETGDLTQADTLFASLPEPRDPAQVANAARHLIRSARFDRAVTLLEAWIARDRDHLLWPYLSLAWRVTANAAWHDLEDDERFFGVYDIGEKVGDLDALATHLRGLHRAVAPPLDQSVRGGTQTDGNLLLRIEEPIARLRAALMDAVSEYVGQLPGPRAAHPTLLERREPLRLSGSWSVRLNGEGFHASHIHNQGWISSAFYVALPDAMTDGSAADAHAGWLALGEARELVPGLEPLRLVEPRPGRLVLFPSTTWHGTRPFSAGERLTAAFDIARPKQS